MEDIKQRLVEVVCWPLQHPKLFGYMKAVSPRGILLYGPPGSGKTLLGKALSAYSNSNLIYMSSSEIINRWQGESENTIRKVFRKARRSAPCIVFLDELDVIRSQAHPRHLYVQHTHRRTIEIDRRCDLLNHLRTSVVDFARRHVIVFVVQCARSADRVDVLNEQRSLERHRHSQHASGHVGPEPSSQWVTAPPRQMLLVRNTSSRASYRSIPQNASSTQPVARAAHSSTDAITA